MSLSQRQLALLLIAPGLALVAALFVYPLSFSLISAFTGPDGGFSLQSFGKAWELYSGDVVFTIVIVLASCFFTGLAAIVIAGTLTLGENPYEVGRLMLFTVNILPLVLMYSASALVHARALWQRRNRPAFWLAAGACALLAAGWAWVDIAVYLGAV